MLCHRCQIDLPETELREVNYPVISEEGRDIHTAMLCASCGPIVMMDSERVYSRNNRLMDLMMKTDISPAEIIEANQESDYIYPLIPYRVASGVPASLEAWLQLPSKFIDMLAECEYNFRGKE